LGLFIIIALNLVIFLITCEVISASLGSMTSSRWEETEEALKLVRTQSNNNNWLFNFLTTNINIASKIRAFKIDDQY
jgi:hypothetical protein